MLDILAASANLAVELLERTASTLRVQEIVRLSLAPGFLLAAIYVLGMAIAYATAGVAAGLSGAMLSATLQNPWVLGSFALIFVVLALAMLGVYELQLPVALQSMLGLICDPVANRVEVPCLGKNVLAASHALKRTHTHCPMRRPRLPDMPHPGARVVPVGECYGFSVSGPGGAAVTAADCLRVVPVVVAFRRLRGLRDGERAGGRSRHPDQRRDHRIRRSPGPWPAR